MPLLQVAGPARGRDIGKALALDVLPQMSGGPAGALLSELASRDVRVKLDGENILALSPYERAARGLFLAFQSSLM